MAQYDFKIHESLLWLISWKKSQNYYF